MAHLDLVLVLDFLGREATVRSFNGSSESKYFPAFEEKNPSKGNSTKEMFVPCSLDLDLQVSRC